MKKSNLYLIGGLAVVGYFLYKNSAMAGGYGGYGGQGQLPGGGGYGYGYGPQGQGQGQMAGVFPNRRVGAR